MDNPTRWNITNSAQNIVSALVDPSKQYDHVFRREWSHTFSGFSKLSRIPTTRAANSHLDSDLKSKLTNYIKGLEERRQIKNLEASREANLRRQENSIKSGQNILDVPRVFLKEDFDLSNLETFNDVLNSGKIDNSESKVKQSRRVDHVNHGSDYDDEDFYYDTKHSDLFTKAELKELQQDFTDYLDSIEERLSSQISNRSGDFFQVMSSVDSVMDELSLAIKSVTNLRKKCSKLNEELIMPNIKNIRLSRLQNNAKLVLEKMKQVADICKVQPMIQMLLASSDYNGALDLIAKSRQILNKELTRVVCLKHLESQLLEIERVIGLMMQHEFNEQQKFVNEFHEQRKKKIESNLDIEQWKMVDRVPEDFQRLITSLVDDGMSISSLLSDEQEQQVNGSMNHSFKKHCRAASETMAAVSEGSVEGCSIRSIDKQILGLQVNDDCSAHRDSRSSRSAQGPNSQGSQMTNEQNHNLKSPKFASKSHYVTAKGCNYVIVESVICLIRVIMEYCKCAHETRSLGAEFLERLLSILQLFNSKTFNLVYNAGALQIAGLKTITARSLVLSQRSIKLIILLIPVIRSHFSKLLPDDNRLRRFEEIKRSYEDHAAKIPERIISIVSDVINLQLREWGAKPPVPSEQFKTVAQHLMRLHDNIQDALPSDDLRALFVRISETFKDALVIHLRRLKIENDAGPRQWLVTQELTFYRISLSKLNVFGDLELNYDDLWTRLKTEHEPAVACRVSEIDTNSRKGDATDNTIASSSGSATNCAINATKNTTPTTNTTAITTTTTTTTTTGGMTS